MHFYKLNIFSAPDTRAPSARVSFLYNIRSMLLSIFLGAAIYALAMIAIAITFLASTRAPSWLVGDFGTGVPLNSRQLQFRTDAGWIWQTDEQTGFGLSSGEGYSPNLWMQNPSDQAAIAEFNRYLAVTGRINRSERLPRPRDWQFVEDMIIRSKKPVQRVQWFSIGWPLRAFWFVRVQVEWPRFPDIAPLAGTSLASPPMRSMLPGTLGTLIDNMSGIPTGVRMWAFTIDIICFSLPFALLFNRHSLLKAWLNCSRRRNNLCLHCGYSRYGIQHYAPCPECGQAK